MFGKTKSASDAYIMSRAKAVGNIKENRKGGTTEVNHDKKTGMKNKVTATPMKNDKATGKNVSAVERVSRPRLS